MSYSRQKASTQRLSVQTENSRREAFWSQNMSLDHPLMDPDGESLAPTGTMVMLDDDNVKAVEAYHAVNTSQLFWPLEWPVPLPIQIIFGMPFVPFIGLCWCRYAIKERLARRVVGHNPWDWLVIACIGLFHQCAVLGLITAIVRQHHVQCYFPTDFYGAVIFYPTSIVYLYTISLTFRFKQGSRRVTQTNEKLAKWEVTSTKANAITLLEQFRISTSVPIYLLIPFSIALSTILLLIIRVCIGDSCLVKVGPTQYEDNWSRFTLPLNATCEPDMMISVAPPGTPLRYQDLAFNLMNVFWVLLISATCMCASYSVILYYQQVRQIEEFTYIQKYSKKRPFLKDLNDFSKDVAVWANVWQDLLEGINNRPVVRAFISNNFGVAFILWTGSAFYLVFQTALNQSEVGELTTACAALLGFNTIVLGVFIAVTISLQRVIEYQVRSISAAQNDLQRQIDEQKMSMDREKLLQMMSNCRVLAALDVYLSVDDNRPKIVESVSLESMRWIAVIGGLLAMNIFFFSLYVSKCYGDRPASA